VRTEQSQSVTLRLVSGGKESSGDVLSHFGPVRAGLTRQPTTLEVQLMESLSSLEKHLATLESKFLEVLNTFLSDTEHLAKPSLSIIEEIGTDK
jgi:hypothetical protein